MSHSQIAILGAGAIGQLLAKQLAPLSPWLITRDNQQINTGCFNSFIYEQDQQNHTNQFYCLPTTASSKQFSTIKLLIVTTKAYQAKTALTPLLPKLTSDAHILLLHNGMGAQDAIAKLNIKQGISVGTTSQAALKVTSNHIKQTGNGVTLIGDYAGRALPVLLKQQLLTYIPNAQWHENIQQALWTKLAINAAINPLTAINNITNGELIYPKYQVEIDLIIRELVAVAKTQRIDFNIDELKTTVNNVIQNTAANFSSMHQDIFHGRITEIDFINGYIVSLAHQHQIATPMNASLTTQVHALEPH